MEDAASAPVVLVRSGLNVCALPLASVVETMRPLPIAPLPGAPPPVLGVAIVRGEPVPVVDLGALVAGGPQPGEVAGFVTVRAGGRTAALAVSAVAGVARLDPSGARDVPLVRDACAGALESLRARDGDLVLVVGGARLVPDEAVAALGRREGQA